MRTREALWALVLLGTCALPARALYESAASIPDEPTLSRAPVILDPGHGGEDLGAVAGRRYEKNIALAIARRVKAKLEAYGAPARLTRDADVFIPLDQRVNESSTGEALAFISLHVDQVRSRKQRGIRVFAFGKNQFRSLRRRRARSRVAPLPPPPQDEARASNALAAALVRSLRAQGLRVDPPAKAGFYVLKNPNIPSVLIEMGYLSNPQEAKQLADPAYQERLAEAIAVSLQSHFAAVPAQPMDEQEAVVVSERPASSGASR